LRELVGESLAMVREHLRKPVGGGRDQHLDPGAALEDHVGEARALACAGGAEIGEPALEQIQRRFANRPVVDLRHAEHTGPAQHVERVDARGVFHAAREAAGRREDPRRERVVDHQLGVARRRRLETQLAVQLATPECPGRALAQLALEHTELVGQPR
jgi:hypothetical protein